MTCSSPSIYRVGVEPPLSQPNQRLLVIALIKSNGLADILIINHIGDYTRSVTGGGGVWGIYVWPSMRTVHNKWTSPLIKYLGVEWIVIQHFYRMILIRKTLQFKKNN